LLPCLFALGKHPRSYEKRDHMDQMLQRSQCMKV